MKKTGRGGRSLRVNFDRDERFEEKGNERNRNMVGVLRVNLDRFENYEDKGRRSMRKRRADR